jgi:hypothetical protein
MNYELERMWKEAVVALRNLPGQTSKNYEEPQSGNQSPYRDLNPGPPKYETEVLANRARRKCKLYVAYRPVVKQ